MVDVPSAIAASLPPLIDVGRHYDRAPIAEAIIELRCVLPSDVEVQDLQAFGADRPDLVEPDRQLAVRGEVTVDGPDVSLSSSHDFTGLNFRREDGSRVISIHLDRFALSWLPPYDTWEAFLSEAEREWHAYRAVARPSAVTRVGVRFVNRLEVPSPAIEIRDYLRTTADISNYLPQAIHGYFMQVALPLDAFDAHCQITTATVPGSPGSTGLVLDIDTWRDTDIDLAGEGSSEAIEKTLHTLRFAKNYVFEACITDATRGLIS